MIYFDTSFLVPLLLEEATSSAAAAVMRGLPADELTLSHWTLVEFSSLLAQEVRTGGLDQEAAVRVGARFEAMVAEFFALLLPTTSDFALARHYLRVFETGLRAGDALHLAIAKNPGARLVCSLDKGLLKAGEILGLAVSMGMMDQSDRYDVACGASPWQQRHGALLV